MLRVVSRPRARRKEFANAQSGSMARWSCEQATHASSSGMQTSISRLYIPDLLERSSFQIVDG